MFDKTNNYAQELNPENRLTLLSDLEFDVVFKTVLRRVYLWMMLGLMLTAGAAYVTVATPFGGLIFGNMWIFFGLMFLELALVITLSRVIQKLHPSVAGLLFFTYAAVNGVTLSTLFLVYELGSIATAFFVASALFGAMSLIGYSTRKDLSQWGSYLLMGLIGLLMASVVNIFFASSGMDWMISIIGVLLFLGLTIYDTQRIKIMTAESIEMGDEEIAMKMGILGALRLYLDFVNLFLYLLRFLGRRRN